MFLSPCMSYLRPTDAGDFPKATEQERNQVRIMIQIEPFFPRLYIQCQVLNIESPSLLRVPHTRLKANDDTPH